ncbi:MAG: mechanosensitive ion channel family protein, partial [Bacteroidia bacterium]|nr:mechanosensitive ion channel family protein [Bacteroidia bacterium]
MEELLNYTYFNNAIQNYLVTTGYIAAGILVIRLFRNIILKRLRLWAEKTETTFDDLVINGVERFMLPIFNFGVIYYAIQYLTISIEVEKIIRNATAVILTYYAVRVLASTFQLMLRSFVLKQDNGEEKIKQLGGISIIINIIIWGMGLVFLIDNLGYNVTAIITGLGIGGI